ncbi:PEROXISOMAL SARCOSINE OXIDASE [Salix koriyanagi]|uniref:PEROXISOMAL SARCOSINE OXIDASE n=1 Tax=Salix koriyanagi TaxID=2511006 RepID=A0A9Q0W1M5_9ROSI|nr:PEROXISOMAL SARCOSINE OXIDASE [Salix koriyanagi]
MISCTTVDPRMGSHVLYGQPTRKTTTVTWSWSRHKVGSRPSQKSATRFISKPSNLIWARPITRVSWRLSLAARKSPSLIRSCTDSKWLTDSPAGLPYRRAGSGVLTEVGGVIKPTKAVSMFQALAFQKGAVLRDNMEVKNIVKDEVKGGVNVVVADGEKFWGKKCVVTAGAWMSKLVKTVSGLQLPIQALETAVCYWRIKEGHEAKFAIGSDFPYVCKLRRALHIRHAVVGVSGIAQDCRAWRVPL